MHKLESQFYNGTQIDNSFANNLENTIEFFKEKNEKTILKNEVFNRLFPISQEEGFYMNQKIGNCYLIAAINAMRLNPYFMEELYKNIEFSEEENLFKTKVSYTFAYGEKVTISIKDLKKQKEDIVINYMNPKSISEFKGKILMKVEKKGDLEKIKESGKAKVYFDSRGKKRILFSNELIDEINDQMIIEDGEYYNLLGKEEEYPSVDAPIRYKILEALYTAKKGNSGNRKNMIEGFSKKVITDFLGHKKWDFRSYLLVNNDSLEIKKILEDFSTRNYIMTASIHLNKLAENFTPYFEYNGYQMADGHAYSIVGYDKQKEEIHVVNPWNNNEILYFSLQDFFKLFSSIFVAKRKDS